MTTRKQFTTPITYFLQEGRNNLSKTLAIAFRAARLHNIAKIVIFTAKGEGVRLAVERFLSQADYERIKVVAVTFPKGKIFTDATENVIQVAIAAEDESFFREHGIPIIRAHLPFDPISPPFAGRGVLAQDLCLVGDALNMFCGSMSLCVQAITLACDAGAVELGEHVVSLTSDTAILAKATSTRRMLEELIIREVLCKPAILTIGRKELAKNIGSVPRLEERKQLMPASREIKPPTSSTE